MGVEKMKKKREINLSVYNVEKNGQYRFYAVRVELVFQGFAVSVFELLRLTARSGIPCRETDCSSYRRVGGGEFI